METWQWNPYIILLALGTAYAYAFAYLSWLHRSSRGARAFTILLLLIAGWGLSYTFEMAGGNYQTQYEFLRMKSLFLALLPVAWLVFSVSFTGKVEQITRRNILLLSMIPLLTCLLIITNDYHNLVWQETWLVRERGLYTLDMDYGPWFIVHIIYSFMLIIVSALHLVVESRMRSEQHKGRFLMVAASGLIPLLGSSLAFLATSKLMFINITITSFYLAGALLTASFLYYRFFDLIPVAHNLLIQEMEDPVLVLDKRGQVVDSNLQGVEFIKTLEDTVFMEEKESRKMVGWEILREYSRATKRIRRELCSRHGDDSRYFDLSASPLRDSQGKIQGRLLTLHDISQRKRDETALRETNQELERANKMKSAYVGIVSHDFANPLGIIQGNMELLQTGAYGEVNSGMNKRVNMALKAVSRMNRLRKDTLNLAQMDLGEMKLEKARHDICSLLVMVVEEMKHQAKEKDQTIDFSSPEPLYLEFDHDQIHRVLENYVSNALRYTQEGGNVEIDIEAGKEELVIRVTDNGRGISPENLEKIFEPFFRTGIRVEGSTGLGLSIVKGIMDAHDGRYWAKSEGEGKGTSFYLSLPREQDGDGTESSKDDLQT